jgi:diguanylate cyclase (GGDEF)-like protein
VLQIANGTDSERRVKNGFQARITLRVSAVVLVVLLPFAVYHLLARHWLLAALQLLVVIAEALLILFVARGGSPFAAAHAVAVIYSVGTIYVVDQLGLSGSYWLFPVMLSNFYILPMGSAISFNALAAVAGACVLRDQPELAVRLLATLALINVFGYIFVQQVAAQRSELNRLSLIDPLTLAQNRRALDEKLQRVAKVKARQGVAMAAIMLDIDHFKQINDRFDHHVGDDVLRAVVDVIRERLRRTDSLYRYGGEEFVVVAEYTNLEHAMRLAEDLRQRVMAQPFEYAGQVTLSAGVAELQAGEPPMAWVSRADDAMYAAKRAGRNRVCSMPQSAIPAAG